jgi:flagellar basal body-associated protein FliL
MAKPAPAPADAPVKKSKKPLLILAVLAAVAVAGGVGTTLLLGGKGHAEKEEPKLAKKAELAFVPFGDVTVNLAEERLTRYLRAKIIFQVAPEDEKTVTDAVQKHKAVLKNELITYLSDKTLKEVSGTEKINFLRREIKVKFNFLLHTMHVERKGEAARGGELEPELIKEILFEEFVVQ